jgi:hypothetical protein
MYHLVVLLCMSTNANTCMSFCDPQPQTLMQCQESKPIAAAHASESKGWDLKAMLCSKESTQVLAPKHFDW